MWYIFSSRYLTETNAAAAEAEKLSETIGGSMGLGATIVNQSWPRRGGLSDTQAPSLVPEELQPRRKGK